MQRQMASIGFVVGLVVVVALVFEVYQTYQQIMQDIRFQQFMFPYDQPKLAPQYQNIGSFIVMHAIAAAALIGFSLSSGTSANPKVAWLIYSAAGVLGIVAGFGMSKFVFGVAILVGVVSILNPLNAQSESITPSALRMPTQPSVQSTVTEIERLEGLLKRGLIDQAEFQQLKSKILRRGE